MDRISLVHRPHHISFTILTVICAGIGLGVGLRLAQTAHIHVHKGFQLLSAIFGHMLAMMFESCINHTLE